MDKELQQDIPERLERSLWNDVNVMIVEDSPTQALILEISLKQKGCRIQTAQNGLDAIEKIKSSLPTLIISDVVMPGMNGYELCRAVKSDDSLKSIPVILLTSLFDPVDVIKAIQCGADNFLVKPCPKELLYFHIENILVNCKLRQSGLKDSFDFYFGGVRYNLPMNPVQITDLLLSTYSSATARNLEYHEVHHDLNLLKNELAAKNDELERIKQQKNHLMKIAQNYLSPSLTAIQSDCITLLYSHSDTLSPEDAAVLSRVKERSDSMVNLIQEFLDMSVVESLSIRLEMHRQSLSEIIKANLDLNQKLALKKDISLEFKTGENIPDVLVDSYRFEQVLNILINNAMKNAPPGSKIMIMLEKTTSEVVLTVRDEGKGLSPSQVDNLFGLYDTLSKQGALDEGSGLNLAIAKNIINEHHGRIWFQDEGHGTAFCIALPID